MKFSEVEVTEPETTFNPSQNACSSFSCITEVVYSYKKKKAVILCQVLYGFLLTWSIINEILQVDNTRFGTMTNSCSFFHITKSTTNTVFLKNASHSALNEPRMIVTTTSAILHVI